MNVKITEDNQLSTQKVAMFKETRKLIEKNRVSLLVSFTWRWSAQTKKVNMLWYSESDLNEFKRCVCKWK